MIQVLSTLHKRVPEFSANCEVSSRTSRQFAGILKTLIAKDMKCILEQGGPDHDSEAGCEGDPRKTPQLAPELFGVCCRKDLNNLPTAVGRVCVLQGRWFVART